ncbi:MAG: large conductance mechanosensitive channel [Chloroflexota bacterium]|nr:large conductance mechanosensitive channel [Chloroflexota bacterium]
MISQFREFIMRGNIVDLAIAVVLGAAFGAVIASFVADILTPLLGLVGLPDFKEAAITVGDAQVRYGQFINALISFVAIAMATFLFVVKPMNAIDARRQPGDEEAPATKTCTECATEIPEAARRCPNCTSKLG